MHFLSKTAVLSSWAQNSEAQIFGTMADRHSMRAIVHKIEDNPNHGLRAKGEEILAKIQRGYTAALGEAKDVTIISATHD
jgi:hypothetical protein